MLPDWEFAHIDFLWALLILPLLVLWHVLQFWKNKPVIGFSQTAWLTSAGNSKTWLIHFAFALRLLAISAMIVGLARPQSSTKLQSITTEGIDIIMAMDISSSMLARDFEPNRLDAAKEVATEFIKGRPNDRIGLVVYSGESFTQCPLTTDHDKLINLLAELKNGMITDGTAIGMGLATAVNRLKESTAKSKVVILLTDGENNSGNIPPLTAAEIATTFGVRVYTIGVGTVGEAPMPYQDVIGRIRYQNVPVTIDEKTLTQIADLTDGEYFRATDNQKLKDIYHKIDSLEKTIIEETQFEKKSEEFLPLALLALGLLMLEFLIKRFALKSAITDV
ncbi:MAG: VWA domain-containing protein [Salibacteraceae bacterium]|jgi:Ca-activated chloride channel homolog|nr:VWA domain-containing protein [Salibacteraceae bacterium]MDP4843747.1 VWA domain-containing protein [Salibacteraceae bacterium]